MGETAKRAAVATLVVIAMGAGALALWKLKVIIALVFLGITPVLGDAVGLSPLLVLISVTAVGILFGGFAVILAVPLAALLATLVDVVLRNRDPAAQEVPTVLFPAEEAEN
jgi:predicted PurR-regulated permease PerM